MYLEIEGAEKYRAALYIRLSREDETDGPSESVSNQRAMLEDFARQRGVPVAGLYVDDGVSGGGAARRGGRFGGDGVSEGSPL